MEELSKIKIIEINSFNDFIALKDTWNSVLRGSNLTVFSTWEWLTTWWKHFGDNKKLLILLAEENNKIIGVAPLMYSVYTRFGAKQGVIEFIGADQHSGYSDFVLTTEHEKCLRTFFDYLNKLHENWSFARLTHIQKNGNCLKPLYNMSANISPAHSCFTVPLPKSYEAFLNNVKRKDRKEFRRNMRRLENAGLKIQLADYSAPNSITEGINNLRALHQERWRVKGGFSGMFADKHFFDFSLDIAKQFSQAGQIGLYCLELSGKPVAALLGLKYKSRYYAYISGLDSTCCQYSVGNLLYLHVMARLIQEGLAEFDFLWGADAYKKQWNPIVKETFNAIVLRRDLLSVFNYIFYEKYTNGMVLLSRFLKTSARKNQHLTKYDF